MLARLDNGVDVDNEEQGAPVSLCLDPLLPWASSGPDSPTSTEIARRSRKKATPDGAAEGGR